MATSALPLATGLLVAGAPGAYAAGMPQLDFGNPLVIGQVIWGAAIFLVFYLIVSRSALPRVSTVIANRDTQIANDLDIARDAKAAADQAVEELRRARHDAAREAQDNIERVINEARSAAAQQTAAMNARLAREIHEAEARLSEARTKAMGSLRDIAQDAASTMVRQLTGIDADAARLRTHVDAAAGARGH
ncbi:hypothetical protein KGY14_08950 [Ameyamaea chiangmaiensis]|uniref:ATP synthase subunit b n=1 Tax=Ameyamaea chiangmaiensis TaxID=442969 RepID=A0A850PG69_9PROT|nr:hypothetical protein [Ameyamaea chiangmaiensis]NVN41833.1 hypothetical protein [Ameyamaea chiangmaiensis]